MEGDASFGAWVRRRRKAFDLLQKELAARVGCSVTALQKIERDERRPSRHLAERLADSLGVPAEERASFLQVARGERMAERLNSASEVGAPPAEAQHSPEPARSELMPPAAPLIGRETELANLALLLRDSGCRLLTLTGPGGIGKTRLALVAAQQHDAFTQGVAFAALAPLLGRDQVVTAMADALGCVLYGTRDRADQLVQFLRGKALLVVLDNFEHLLADAACVELIGQLLHGTDRLKLLVTSREPLDIQEEWVFDVQGLPTPLSSAPHDLEASSAARLFQQRARQARAGYTLSAEDTAAVVQICQLVGGVPLGIELAAAWMRTLSCQEIADEIQRNLDFLATRARDVPERHRSIRAVFDQSWALLTAEEQRVLRRVSVFQGGFTRAAAEEVAGASLALLAALVTKSLLRRMTAGCYDPHELVRQYALDQLRADEREAAETRARHCRYYARLLEQRGAAFKGPDQVVVVAELASELANIRQAWDWACTQQLATELSQAADTLFWLYEAQSNFREGIPLFGRAVESLRVADSQASSNAERAHQLALGQALSYQGFFCFRQGQHPLSRALLQRSVALLRQLAEAGAPQARAAVSTAAAFLGIVTYRMGDYAEGRHLLGDGLAIKRTLGDRWGTALCLRQLGLAAYSQGEYAEAHQLLSESLALSRAMGNPWSLAFSLNFLSRVAFAQGAYDEAQQLLEEGLALSRNLSDRFNMASAQNGLGMVHRARGQASEARHSFEASIAIWREIGDQDSLAQCLNQLGETLLVVGDRSAARDCFVEALTVAREAQVAPVMLDALLGLAALCAEQGAVEASLELVLHILENPASTQEARGRARQLREVLERHLSPQEVEIIRSRAHARSLSELAAPERIAGLLGAPAARTASGQAIQPATPLLDDSAAQPPRPGASVDSMPAQPGFQLPSGPLEANRETPPLLTTKLYIPTLRPQVVSRPRLVARVQAGVLGKLTLIAAPAGYGKTTLLSAWAASLAEGDIKLAWVALDADDNDVTRFWKYVIASLETIYPAVGTTVGALLQSPQPPPIEVIITNLINGITLQPINTVLILDDYHVIATPAIHAAITFLLDHLPAHLHLVMTTRTDPPLPLTRLRTRGELTELRAADLRFTGEETAAFLTEVMDLAVSAEDASVLEGRTEGWIASLQLAALAMRDRRDLTGFIQGLTGSNRFVVDYLVEEVLDRLPTHLHTFVLQTSILDRLCGPLCDAVLGITMNDEHGTMNSTPPKRDSSFIVHPSSLGDSYSQLILEQLERANLFVVSLDDERRWYRYHHLFAEVLRARLASGAAAAAVAELHRRASAWYDQQGLVTSAMQHTFAAGDYDRASNVIEQHGVRLAVRGHVDTVLGWVSALPDTLLRTHTGLALTHAVILLLAGHVQEAEARLQDAERSAETTLPPDQLRMIQGRVAATRASLVRFSGDIVQCVELSRKALDLLPETEQFWRAPALVNAARAYLVSGDVTPTAEEQVAAVIAPARASGSLFSYLAAVINLARLQTLQGRLRRAAASYGEAAQIAPDRLQHLLNSAAYYVGMGDLMREWNDFDAAEQYLAQGLDIVRRTRNVDADVALIGYVALARTLQARGNTGEAFATLALFERLARERGFSPSIIAHAAAAQARLALAQGELQSAVSWAQGSGLRHDQDVNFPREQEYLVCARVLIATCVAESTRTALSDATSLLERLLAAAEIGGRMRSVIEILNLRALVFQLNGDTPAAIAALERALQLAEPEGYIRIFVDEGAPMAALLRMAAGRHIVASYLANLLAAFPETMNVEDGAMKKESLAHHSSFIVQPLAEPLTDRELEILRLIAEGYSNQAIADTLIIAVSTVKRHINNIYGKLGVQSRTQALLRAREFQLL